MISSKTIEDAVYNLCVEANTTLNDDVFSKILDAYDSEKNHDAKQALGLILKNAKMAYEKKMPLCQDTGQVLIFVKIGHNCCIQNLNELINNAVAKAYQENFYRKSIVKNALFERVNTKTNTPCVIYTEIVEGREIEMELLVKGAGCENVSAIEMLSPTASEDEIVEFVVSVIKKAGSKGCPPYFLGIGIGGTIDYAGVLSKKALLLKEDIDENHKKLADKIKDAVNNLNIGVAGLGGAATVLDVKLLTDFTHIANMPVAVTVNCHSSRHVKCIVQGNDVIYYPQNKVKNYLSNEDDFSDFIEVNTSDIEKLKSLKQGQKILLTGEIYTARDMAHKRLVEMIEKGEELPFDLKDKIIFYAGPCPGGKCHIQQESGCIIGSVGPTTASRMDKYASILYEKGVLATIGKGERSEEVKKTMQKVGGLYFTAIGGIACYLSDKVRSNILLGFEEFGTEAIYKISVVQLPLRLSDR